MCIFANEGGPKSKSSRKETPLKIQKYKEKHVSGKNLEKMFSAPTPTTEVPLYGITVYGHHISRKRTLRKGANHGISLNGMSKVRNLT